MKRAVLLAAALGATIVGVLSSTRVEGRITVKGEPGVALRIRATVDSNVTLVSAAETHKRSDGGVDVLTPAVFAIKPGGSYYARFDAADSSNVILLSAVGGRRFGFWELGSRYKGVSVVCGSQRGSGVHPLRPGASLADRSCPE